MKKIIQIILVILMLCLLGLVLFVRVSTGKTAEESVSTPLPTEEAAQVSATPEPTPEPTPVPTPEVFTLSFIGDNALCSNSKFKFSDIGFEHLCGDDMTYPYSNVAEILKNDEYTMGNLECTFSDEQLGYDYTVVQFPLLASTKYSRCLIDGGIDFLTMANNHTMDFYEAGVQSTKTTLEEQGIPYGYENQGQIVTTEHGIKLGIWTAGNDLLPNKDKAVAGIADLKSQGADLVICMFHNGQELYYSPNDNQTALAHACVDAGADIVYASHPHCLQPIEIYNGKIIMYSLGNFAFGGNTMPSDPDTAIVQVDIIRDIDGTVRYDSFKAIPCAVTSNLFGANAKANNSNYNDYANYNDYRPTPYAEGSEDYERVMSKLQGTFKPASQGADYSNYYASWA